MSLYSSADNKPLILAAIHKHCQLFFQTCQPAFAFLKPIDGLRICSHLLQLAVNGPGTHLSLFLSKLLKLILIGTSNNTSLLLNSLCNIAGVIHYIRAILCQLCSITHSC